MKTSSASRPCAEFPCDNPRLYASDGASNRGRAEPHTGAPPQVAERADAGACSSEFDWAATDYWVKEVKRRWRVAKADAPEVNLPVLDAMGLELLVHAHEPTAFDVGDGALMLEESALLTESGVMLGELLVMPSETLFDDTEHAFTVSALGLELAERGALSSEGLPPLDAFVHAESGEVPIVEESGVEGVSAELALATEEGSCADASHEGYADASHEGSDPFIDELMSLLPSETNGSTWREIVSRGEGVVERAGASVEEAGQVRAVPAVAEGLAAARPLRSELFVRPSGVQPLAPLQLELTPTPAALSPWSELTGALSRHLLSGGHTRAAALVAPLLCGELVDFNRVEPAAVQRLIHDGIVEVRGGRPVTSATFRHAAKTFREEFGAGGLNAGDALFWLSQVLVALCGGRADEETLEGELRDLGVAKLLEWAA